MNEVQPEVALDTSDENRAYSTPLLEEESTLEEFSVEEPIENKSVYSIHNLFRKYDAAKSSRPSESKALPRVLSIWQLIAFGISSTVGAGVLVTIGLVSSKIAGPGVALSFVFAGFASFLSALCYSEFATRIPVSGSAYTYAYASFGEVFAWFIGWDLMLEYTVSASAIARGWTSYFVSALTSIGIHLPSWVESYDINEYISISFVSAGIIIICTIFLLGGMNTSAKFTLIFTIFNLVLLFFFIITGSFYVDTNNWTPFLPYGLKGTWRGVGIVFFSYIGFDSVSTLSGEVKNPAKALPIGIVGTLGFATSLYVVISLVVTGMSPYYQIDAESPLSTAFERLGLTALSVIVALGSLTTMTATMLVSLLGQPRIFYQMSMDGLFPPFFSEINKNGIPGKGTIVTGVGSATLALFFNLDSLSQMISVGTLLAFVLVSGGILILRYQQPHDYETSRIKKVLKSSVFIVTTYCFLCFFFSLCVVYSAPLGVTIVMGIATVASLTPLLFLKQVPAPVADPPSFRTPWVPFVPALGILMNIYFIVELPGSAMVRVVIWAAIGMCIYFAYGVRHSVMNKQVKINQSYSQ